MKKLAIAAMGVAGVSLIVGIISRLTLTPVFGILANAFLRFTNTSLLAAIALLLLQIVQAKEK